MAITVGEDELIKCVAMTATPEYIDLTGQITGVRNSVYNPTFVGERGWMLYSTAKPLDLPTSPSAGLGDLATCYFNTVYDIDAAMAAATPIVAGAQQVESRKRKIKQAEAAMEVTAPTPPPASPQPDPVIPRPAPKPPKVELEVEP